MIDLGEAPAPTFLRGVAAVALTMFDSAGRIDLQASEQHLVSLDKAGFASVVVGGNTGEFSSLSAQELQDLYQVAKGAVLETPLVLGIGGSIAAATAMAEDVQGHGAAAIMLHEPSQPYATVIGIDRYILEVSRASPVPVIMYVRTEKFPNAAIHSALSDGRVAGVKDARNDLVEFAKLASSSREGVLVCGSSELWAPFYWAAGAVGFTSGIANCTPRLSLAMFRSLAAGDMSEVWRLWRLAEPLETIRSTNSGGASVSALKYALELLGGIRGSVRPPLSELSMTGRQEVAAVISRWRNEQFV